MSAATDKSNLLRSEAELILDNARGVKAERTKDEGEPIKLAGVALAIQVRDNYAWIAENTAAAKKIDLETGKIVSVLRGHSAPVTSLVFFEKSPGTGDGKILITGSWDKCINVWDTESKKLISSTSAHSDFVKSLLVIPSCKLLISGSSDKIVRFWDLSSCLDGKPLTSVGSISAHSRPVEAMDARSASDSSAVLYTADTMGQIKVWELTKEVAQSPSEPPIWRSSLIDELKHHRTGVNEMIYGNQLLWTASSDETVQFVPHPPPPASTVATKPTPPIAHPRAVRTLLPLSLTPLAEPYLLTGSGDVIRTYDISSPDEPELLSEIDSHWHDVTALRFWMRKTIVDDQGTKKTTVEPWIVSTSLDGTIRKWKLSDLLHPPPPKVEEAVPEITVAVEEQNETYKMSEEEERELAELMGDD